MLRTLIKSETQLVELLQQCSTLCKTVNDQYEAFLGHSPSRDDLKEYAMHASINNTFVFKNMALLQVEVERADRNSKVLARFLSIAKIQPHEYEVPKTPGS